MKTLADRLYELCLEIDQLPASEQQTKVSLLASDILKSVGGLTPRAADVARRCPECKALLEETSVYCDNCGTDTPRR